MVKNKLIFPVESHRKMSCFFLLKEQKKNKNVVSVKKINIKN